MPDVTDATSAADAAGSASSASSSASSADSTKPIATNSSDDADGKTVGSSSDEASGEGKSKKNKDKADDANNGEGQDSGDDKQQKEKPGKDAMKKAQMAAQAANAAQAAVQVVWFFQLMMYLKLLMQTIMAAAVSLLQALLGILIAAAKAVAAAVVTAVTAVASFFSTTATVVAGFFAGLFTVFVAVVVVVVVAVTGNLAIRDDMMHDDCVAQTRALAAAFTGDISEQTRLNAAAVYSVFTAYGYSNQNIAGILGNFDVESGVDPTGVETIYGEPHTFFGSQRKTIAETHNFHVNLYPYGTSVTVGGSTVTWNKPMYQGREYWVAFSTLKDAPGGIGLGQWTFDRNTNLRNFASSAVVADAFSDWELVSASYSGESPHWSDIEVQLLYMITDRARGGDTQFRVDKLKGWAPAASPMEAATWFAEHWEGNTSMATGERQTRAAAWYVTVNDWEAGIDYESEYGESIVALAETIHVPIGDGAVTSAARRCRRVELADNSTLAAAAVSYAWEDKSLASNDGTPLYQAVKRAIMGNGDIMRSCCRGVSTAVLWSGTDDDFPWGGVEIILNYLLDSDKWEEIPHPGGVGFKGGASEGISDTDPAYLPVGTIMIRSDKSNPQHAQNHPGYYDASQSLIEHVELYVGNEMIRKKFPDADSDKNMVQASYQTRSPACSTMGSTSSHWYLGRYRAFVFVGEMESDPRHKNAGSSMYVSWFDDEERDLSQWEADGTPVD